ncbi:MAG: phage major capsid protein [Pseudomonadota bacterium]
MAKKTDLKVLRQRAADLRAEGKKMTDELDTLLAVDEPTEEQTKRLEELQANLAQWELDAAEAGEALQAAEDKARRSELSDTLRGSQRIIVGKSYGQDPSRTGGFDNLADFALTVMRAGDGNSPQRAEAYGRLEEAHQLMAAPTNFHQERGSSDGFMVPPAMRDQIYELMLDDQAALLNAVDSEPTAGNQVGMLRDETTPWGSSGVVAAWRAEGTKMDPSRVSTDETYVHLHELYAFVLASEELLQDAPRLNARLTRQAARAINWKASEAIMHGTGAGQPLGWMNAPALVVVAKEGPQAADTIVADNIAKMYSRMMPSSLPRANWYINNDVMPQLITMTLGDQPIWTPPSTGLVGAPGGILMGRPVIPLEHNPTLGDAGDIQFVDPMGYYSPRKSSGVSFAESIHLYFDYNIRAFRWTFRVGGQPYLSAPVSPAKGTATKSHFVTLAARD